MSKQEPLSQDQLKAIEEALEERKTRGDRRKIKMVMPEGLERRSGKDRRQVKH